MPPKYWIKLYHEILDDPKMARLSDKLYRRVIEIFLLAGKNGEDGALPDPNDMSWYLRLPLDEVVDDLATLAGIGIIEKRGDNWFVTHFAERQATMPQAERMRRDRAGSQKSHYYGEMPVSPALEKLTADSQKAKTEPEKNQRRTRIEPEKKRDSSAQLTGNLFRLLESAGIVLTQHSAEQYKSLFEEADDDVLISKAIEHAKATNTLPNPGWLRTVVLRCKRQNCKPGEWPKRKGGRRDPTEMTPEEQAAAEAMTETALAELEER